MTSDTPTPSDEEQESSKKIRKQLDLGFLKKIKETKKDERRVRSNKRACTSARIKKMEQIASWLAEDCGADVVLLFKIPNKCVPQYRASNCGPNATRKLVGKEGLKFLEVWRDKTEVTKSHIDVDDLEEDNQLSEDDESTEELDFADPDSPGFDDEGAMTPVSKASTTSPYSSTTETMAHSIGTSDSADHPMACFTASSPSTEQPKAHSTAATSADRTVVPSKTASPSAERPKAHSTAATSADRPVACSKTTSPSDERSKARTAAATSADRTVARSKTTSPSDERSKARTAAATSADHTVARSKTTSPSDERPKARTAAATSADRTVARSKTASPSDERPKAPTSAATIARPVAVLHGSESNGNTDCSGYSKPASEPVKTVKVSHLTKEMVGMTCLMHGKKYTVMSGPNSFYLKPV